MNNYSHDPKSIKQWVNYKPGKIPCDGNANNISVTNSSTYMSYEEAVHNKKNNPAIEGIGFVFTSDAPFCGLDLDDCLDENGELINEQVRQFLEGYDGMLEISPSGKGLKMIMRGRKPSHITKSKIQALGIRGIEWYDNKRYFTVTENYWKGRDKIVDVSQLSDKLVKLFTIPTSTAKSIFNKPSSTRVPTFSPATTTANASSTTIDTDELLSRFDGDQSRADLAFCGIVARKYPFNEVIVDAFFRASDFMRPKWDKRHRSDGASYGEITIEKAFSTLGCDNYHDIKAYLRNYFQFRFNSVTASLEFLKLPSHSWEEFTDRDLNAILDDLRIRGGKARINRQKIEEIINTPEISPNYDPIEAYFESLPGWDGKDHITDLVNTLKTTNPGMTALLVKKWLLGMVATIVYGNGTVNHGVLVLKGSQGLGKTSWTIRLLPEHMRGYIHSGTIREESKDTLALLSRNLIINMDEMANMHKREQGLFKELVTKDQIQVRLPYERYPRVLPRRASFIGSVNDSTFLGDLTGSRRFWVLDCKSIDYEHQVDMDKVYAQVLNELSIANRWHLTREEEEKVQKQNQQFQLATVEDELVEQFCQKDPRNKKSATEIRSRLAIISGTPEREIRLRNLGAVLTKRGFETVQQGGVTKYKINFNNNQLGTPPDADQLFN